MPVHDDFRRIRDSMREQYGKKKGDEVYYSWLNKNDLDDSKAMPKKLGARADDLGRDFYNPDDVDNPKDVAQDDGDIAPVLDAAALPISDGLNRSEASHEEIQPPHQQSIKKPEESVGGGNDTPDQHDNIEKVSAKAKEQTTKERNKLEDTQFAYPEERKLPINDAAHVRNALARWNQTDLPPGKKSEVLGRICRAAKKFGIDSDLCESKGKAEAAAGPSIHFPSFKFRYTAEPKFGSDQGEVIIKALVLEQGFNINNWRVDESEFDSVAAQYKAGRQLRLDHSSDVQKIFGKSFDAKVISGADVPVYMGKDIDGIDPDSKFVAAEFIANPTDPQVRMNILKGYVDTGSIGLDANAYCDECQRPVEVQENGQIMRSCVHLTAGVLLKNVDVKEYSYVAEPAFPHSHAFPSFAAAIDHTLQSSLKQSARETAPMSAKVPMQAKAKADADAGNTIDDAKTYTQAEADAYAEARMAIYRKGLADAAKFRADYQQPTNKDPPDPVPPGFNADAEGDAKMDADAEGDAQMKAGAAGGFKDQPAGGVPAPGFAPMRGEARRQTDQIGRTNQTRSEMKAAKDDLISQILRPTAYAVQRDPAMKELFLGAANAPGAPLSVKNNVKEAFKA